MNVGMDSNSLDVSVDELEWVRMQEQLLATNCKLKIVLPVLDWLIT